MTNIVIRHPVSIGYVGVMTALVPMYDVIYSFGFRCPCCQMHSLTVRIRIIGDITTIQRCKKCYETIYREVLNRLAIYSETGQSLTRVLNIDMANVIMYQLALLIGDID